MQHDLSAPSIDLPISLDGATVDEQAVPLAEEFVDAQLQDPDLITLRQSIKQEKIPTLKEIARLGARV